jgi:outer membrane protein insertion porin family
VKALIKQLLWLGVLLGSVAQAQTFEPFEVRNLRVEGLQRIPEGTVFNYLPINIGDRVDQRRIQEAVRSVYATGFFRDVEFRRDGGTLVIVALERPSIEEFTITGNKDIKTEDLEGSLRRVGLARGRTFDRSVLAEVTQFLTDQYYSRGKYGVSVASEVEELANNTVRIAIEVKEGERARIRQINVVGNSAFSDDDLLDEFLLKTPHFTSFYKQDDRYARESLQGDLESLRSYYMDRGYADFRVDSTQVTISPDKKDIYITVNVEEGDRYTVSDVKIAGQLVVPEEELRRLIQIMPGETFSQRKLTNTAELFSFRLGQDGYAFADIQSVPELDRDTREVAVTFYVDPQNRVYVRRINFNGADNVNDEVFRREMRQLEGGYLSNTKVERSKIRLQRLPYVESVEFETNPVAGTPDLVDVDFQVEEGLPGQFGGGVGFSESQGVILNGNFVHSNFMGTGNRFAAEINSGRFNKVYSLGFTDPYRNIDGLSRTLSLGFRDITQFTSAASDFSTETITGGVEWGYPITEVQFLRFGLSWQRAQLFANNFSSQQAQAWVLNNGEGFSERVSPTLNLFGTEFDTVELVLGWSYDSRNRAFFANRGTRARFSVNATIPGSDVEYYVASLDYRKYIPLFGRWTLMINAEVAFGDDIGDTTALPPYRNFFGGGPGSVRGFRESRLGPKDSFGNPYGGNAKFASQIELIIPLPEKWSRSARFSAFYDVGNVFSSGDVAFFDRLGDPLEYDIDYDNLKSSVGIAAEWLAPLGLFRFSYAFPLNNDAATDRLFGDELERFQFTIGNAF